MKSSTHPHKSPPPLTKVIGQTTPWFPPSPPATGVNPADFGRCPSGETPPPSPSFLR
ncbi:hypothetical protein HanPSC8_Chr04g0151901 [Helianthus annuus]|nr:hypothetical protein HanPSC8_Chr04g0151901 [Helianthus annuus]